MLLWLKREYKVICDCVPDSSLFLNITIPNYKSDFIDTDVAYRDKYSVVAFD